jgi:hypothetical protein
MIVYLLDTHEIIDAGGMQYYQPRLLSQVMYSSYRDATDDAPAPPLDPNIVVARLEIDQAALDWILASPDYGEGAILYVEE